MTMKEDCSDLLNEVRGLEAARALIDRAIDLAVAEALDTGVSRTELALVLGIHRATLYRQFKSGGCAPLRPEVFAGGRNC